MSNIKSIELAKRTLTLESGKLAPQATSAVLGRYGDSMVLVTVVEGGKREDLDYFPLTVEYVERLYAGGKIKGSRWVKREGRPSDEAILHARLVDRSIRPLFPKEYKNEVQVVVTVLSVDGENQPDVLSIITTSAALAISPIPWKGPIAAVRVGLVKEQDNGAWELIINPHTDELSFSELDLVVSQTREKTVMIETEAREVAEEKVLQAINKAHEENKKIITLIEELTKSAGTGKQQVAVDKELGELIDKIRKNYDKALQEELLFLSKKEGGSTARVNGLVDRISQDLEAEGKAADKAKIRNAVEEALHKMVRAEIIKNGKRIDGRKADQIRPISASVSVLPRTHGSAIFSRGLTQTLTVVTLGSPSLHQLIESAEGEEIKRYMHHYSMPPYSVGEAGRIGYPSRREIGHGALAERALLPVVPPEDKFPYTVRVVSEIMSSNGSTSMASVCGSTLSLMDAGVPITAPVSGIAMGLVSNGEKYIILSDIAGIEDFSGDMDFKVAGTEKGVTAIQLDVKIDGLTEKMIEETFKQGRVGRLFILSKMLETIQQTRATISPFAPKVEILHVDTDKIGEVIGPGGRVIRSIIEQTGATVDVEDDGKVMVTGVNGEQVAKAVEWIKGITVSVQPGQIFEGTVKRILPFGAFVEIIPGKEGMVHVSQMGKGFVANPQQVVNIGDKVKVRVVEIDERGRINLSMNLTPGSDDSRARPSLPGGRGRRPFDNAHSAGPRFKRPRF